MPAAFSEFAAADRPLEDPASDTLGRAAFAERIAREFCASKHRDHLIVSLNGECGSGKTTSKNFIRHSLSALGTPAQPAAAMVEFNAWEFRGEERMGRAFFEQVGAQLAAHKDASQLHELGESWQQFGAALFADATSPRFGASLSAAQHAVRAKLETLAMPLVIFIDDIDRLPAAQIEALLGLLGTRTNFPNVICVLLFHKTIVVDALAATIAGSASELLRKLIHVELELPEVPDSLLRRQLESGLEQRLATVTFPPRSRERWNDVMGSAVWPLFSTPRDVQRFLAMFAFPFDGFFHAAEGVLEVNPTDLVLLECLRMFAPPVYFELRDTFRRRETRIVRLMSGREEERKEARVEIDATVQRLPKSNRHKRAIIAALQQLVPLGTGGVQGGRDDWDRDLRFCSPRHVERYFHVGAIIDAIPAHRLIAIARATGDRARLETLLLQAAGENLLPEVLDRLPPLLQGLPENQITITAVALCGICDQIPAQAPEDMEARLVKFASDLFAEVKNPLRRENIVAALLDDPERLTGPMLLLHALRPRSDMPNGNAASLTLEQFRRLIASALEKLKENAASGAIWRSREAGALIKRWWEWSTEKDEVRSWLLHQVKEPAHARVWLRTFLSPSAASPGKELVLQLEELGQYCDPNAVAAAANQATGDAVDRAAAKRLGQVLASKGTSASFALRTVAIPLEAEAA